MPLYDQDGRQTNEQRVSVTADVREVVVRHDEIRFLDANGECVLLVDRPTHPGAGLGLEITDGVRIGSGDRE